ncbi:MAG: CPBP family intramembrane metalloprotease, partial [Sphingomonas bacterium]|nr:CPBP family intramembrane metalloprotease [Sphingomonas bacterium]
AIMIGLGLYRFDYHGPASAWHGAGLAIESGVFEEVFVRGVMLRIMWRAFGPWAAFAISALLFGAGHVGNPGATWFTTACIAIEAGVMLGAFYALTGRLWVSIGVHAAWNFTQGYVFGAAVSGGNFGEALATSTAQTQYPNWLTGGSFGPEASLPAFIVCIAVGALVLWLAWMSGRFPNTRSSAATVDLKLQGRGRVFHE